MWQNGKGVSRVYGCIKLSFCSSKKCNWGQLLKLSCYFIRKILICRGEWYIPLCKKCLIFTWGIFMKIKTLLLVVNLCKFPWIRPRWKCDIFTDKNAQVLLREAKRPFCKKKWQTFCLWRISIPFTEKKKRKGKWSWAVAELYYVFPTFWSAFITNHCAQRQRVKLYHAMNLQMHFRKITSFSDENW